MFRLMISAMLLWTPKDDSFPVSLACVGGDRVGLSFQSLLSALRSKLVLASVLIVVTVRSLIDTRPFGADDIDVWMRTAFWFGYHMLAFLSCAALLFALDKSARKRKCSIGTATPLFYAVPVAITVLAGQFFASLFLEAGESLGSGFTSYFLKEMVLFLIFETFMLHVIWPEYLRLQVMQIARRRRQSAKAYKGDLQKILGRTGHDIRQGNTNQ